MIKNLFGFNGYEELNQKEIGDHFGLTKERARQIKEEAFEELRQPKYEKQLRPFYNNP